MTGDFGDVRELDADPHSHLHGVKPFLPDPELARTAPGHLSELARAAANSADVALTVHR
jgi:hypothetical protein